VTKSEFIDKVAAKLDSDGVDLTKKETAAAVDAVISMIESSLKSGTEVAFTGFGKFHVSKRAARQGVHPRTGEPLQIQASKVPRFTPGASLKKTVNGK